MQLNLAHAILDLTEGHSIAESAAISGLTTNDIKNLRAGNMPSLRSLLCLVRTLRKTPRSLISGGRLQPLPKETSLRGATEAKVRARIQSLSRENDPADLAERSGLSIASIYQYRSLNDKMGLHAYLAFVDAGYDADELLLGNTAKRATARSSPGARRTGGALRRAASSR
jgi:hypothetical protein